MTITRLLFTIILIFTIIGCNDDKIPDDIVGKRKYLAEKKNELRNLQKEIDDLAEEINIQDPKKEKPAIPVETIIAKQSQFKRYLSVEGKVAAQDLANVSSNVGGRIQHLKVKEGQYVRKGALVAILDSETLTQQIQEIETSLNLARTVFERQSRLWDKNIGSEIQYLQAKNTVERLEQSMQTLKTQINKNQLYAPISGVVDVKHLSQGEIAAPGMPIISIFNTEKLKITADLQESLLRNVRVGDSVQIYFPAIDKTIAEKISMIGRKIDPANRTFKIELETKKLKGQLKPNLLAIVNINDYSDDNAIVIALNIVKEEISGQKYIFKIDTFENRKIAIKSPIILGESNVDEVIVESGIQENDEIIVKGLTNLTENALVTSTNIDTENNE